MPAVHPSMRGQSLGAAPVVPLANDHLALGNATADPSRQHLDDAIRILGRAIKADDAIGCAYMIPGYLAEAADALESAGLPELAARCGEDRADVGELHEAALAAWRVGR